MSIIHLYSYGSKIYCFSYGQSTKKKYTAFNVKEYKLTFVDKVMEQTTGKKTPQHKPQHKR